MIGLRHLCFGLGLALATACGSDDQGAAGGDAGDTGDDDSCQPDDQDGVVGGNNKVLLNVSDTGFAVGGVDSGSTQPNIAVQNTSNVTLTITNVGSKPHSFHVACRATDLPAGCPQMSCFPDEANVPAIAPGDRVTVMFSTPAVEGEYEFTSDEPGDEALVGEFVLM